jgi:hypothetical protein
MVKRSRSIGVKVGHFNPGTDWTLPEAANESANDSSLRASATGRTRRSIK